MNLLIQYLSIVRQRLAGRTKIRASLYYAVSSITCQVLRFGGVIVSTRSIASEQFGLFAKATLILTIASLIREIGQSGALVAYQGNDKRYVSFNFQLNFFLGFAAACLAAAAGLFPRIVSPEICQYTWVLGAIIMFDALTLTNTWILQKQFHFRFLGIVEVISLITWLATLSVMLGRMPGFLVLLSAQLAEVLVRCVLLFAKTGLAYVGFSSGKDLCRYYFVQFARPAVPLVIVQGILSRSDYLLLSLLTTTQELGVYERAMQFARIPISLSINLCDKILLHSYSKAQADVGTLRRMVKQGTLVVGGAVTVATAAAAVGLLFFLDRLVGPGWSPMILTLWWFSIPATLMTPITSNLNLLFSGIGMPAQLLRNATVMLLADVAIGVILAGSLGARGMLLTRAFSTAFLLAYQFSAVRRRLAAERTAPVQG